MMFEWLNNAEEAPAIMVAICSLVIAIGAQACPDDYDELAERHFNFGRYITLEMLMDLPNISTVQCHALVSMYLLASSRRNAAFMYLGIAVRGAYALGLHQRDVSLLYESNEYATRERLWRGIRVLDLFMSASLGRPPATRETRDTRVSDGYSASNDLCWIFENILMGIYTKRMITKEILDKISELHREWASRFTEGLETDGILPEPLLCLNGSVVPNIGLIHIKEAYYWTIMLLTRPFLVEHVSTMLEHKRPEGSDPTSSHAEPILSKTVLVQACVDSAIRTADLLQPIVSTDLAPKRLPVVVNCAFASALVLGLALCADLEDSDLIARSFQVCRAVLSKFGEQDAVTKRFAIIIDKLQDVCDTSLQMRKRDKMEHNGQLIRHFFGGIHSNDPTQQGASNRRTAHTREYEALNEIQDMPSDLTSSVMGLRDATKDVTIIEPGELEHGTQSDVGGQYSSFDMTSDVQTFAFQTADLMSPTALWFGTHDQRMLYPTMGSSDLDSVNLQDWN
jgi:hypothetical protein